jgi:DNA-binding HxlR family transcriptional regulator
VHVASGPLRSRTVSQRVRHSDVFRAGDAIGDAWSWLVLREAIAHEVVRFGDFQERLGLPRQTLTARLRHLLAQGLFVTSGPSYELTAAGRAFLPCIVSADAWGRRWAPARPGWPATVHRSCGETFTPIWICAQCKAPAHPWEVQARLQPDELSVEHDGPVARRRTPRLDLLGRVADSPTTVALQVLGDRWSAMVIEEAFLGTRRFDQFATNLGIATNILTQRLGRLVDLGILSRKPYGPSSTRHEYRLTAKGLDVYPIPLSVMQWGHHWLPPRADELVLTHLPCGASLTAVMTCQACGQYVDDDIAFA